ncbi:hypothetical protein BK809_0001203 [Diplodia seriata]|uniref:Uncharacterized protein n=1 Tax=Diplodia seriata TaxID=420778 RepID=A0A1S8B738_9PEZI|nr:hypothetical protein BK809_0001203 [Diplodia seriata]
MAPPKQQKRWILAPTRDLPPSGPIALGAIVTSAKRADQPLHTPSLADLPPSAITTHDTYDWTLDHQRTATGRVGLWTSFCQSLGVGDAGISWTHGARERWEVRRMRTRTLAAAPAEFVEAAARAEAVRAYVARNRFRRRVYMVTGVKTAAGARGFVEDVRERGVDARVGVDATPFGVPVAAGPRAEGGRAAETRVGFGGAEEFVFAFCLREVRVKRSGEVRQKGFRDGDFMGVDELRREERSVEQVGVEVVGLAERDAGGDDLDSDEVEAVEEENGEECVCVKLED